LKTKIQMENFLFLSIVNYHGIIYYFNFVKRMSANDSRYEGYSNDSAGVIRTDNSCEMSIIPSNNYEIFI
jgi:hypothetical protein